MVNNRVLLNIEVCGFHLLETVIEEKSEVYSEPCKKSKMSFFIYYYKNLYLRCLTEF